MSTDTSETTNTSATTETTNTTEPTVKPKPTGARAVSYTHLTLPTKA